MARLHEGRIKLDSQFTLTIDIAALPAHRSSGWNLLRALHDENSNVRLFAAMLLGESSLEDGKRIKALVAVLEDDPDPEVKVAAIASLRKLGRTSNATVLPLTAFFLRHRREDVILLTAVVHALRDLGARTLVVKDRIARLLRSASTPAAWRAGAIIILMGMGTAASKEFSEALVADDCLEVRQLAALALRVIAIATDRQSPEALRLASAFGASLKVEKDAWTRKIIEESLRGITLEYDVKGVAPVDSELYADVDSNTQVGDDRLVEEGEFKFSRERKQRHARIATLLKEAPRTEVASELSTCRELLSLTKQETGERLTGPLNEYLQNQPQDSYEDKQQLATWVNRELRELGLAVRCPKTGKPAILIADVRGGESEGSRFRLEVLLEDSGKRSRTWTGSRLPDLELTEAKSRQEGLAGRRISRD